MSLTEAEHVFAGLHEDGLNDLLRAFFSARPRHLNYGSNAFVPVTTASETNMPSIAFPNIAGGIEWAVSFRIPRIDLFEDSSSGGMPPELSLSAGQFSLHTRVRLRLMCGRRDREKDREEREEEQRGATFIPIEASLDVWATGHLIVRVFGGGSGDIRLAVDSVEIVDIAPEPLEALLECLIRMLLDAALVPVRLPFESLRAGAFSLTLTRGPELEDDQTKLYGVT